MTFGEITYFVLSHPWLVTAMAVALAAVAANEWVLARGSRRPIGASEAVQLMNTEDAVVVDTRSISDYRKNHILHAVHVPIAGIDGRAGEISKDKSRTIICYCGTGTQASQAADKLQKLGYENVYTLRGGISAWEADGLPLTAR